MWEHIIKEENYLLLTDPTKPLLVPRLQDFQKQLIYCYTVLIHYMILTHTNTLHDTSGWFMGSLSVPMHWNLAILH